MRPVLFALLTAALLPAGVVLNTPVAHSAFYDGNTDYFNFDGTGFINGVSSSALPAANDLAAQKVWGSATLAYASDRAPYIVMVAEGSASGAFTVDTQVAVQFAFSTPGLSWEIPFYVQGELSTSNGFYYTETSLFSETGGSGLSAFLAKDGFGDLIPAGTDVLSWRLAILAGSYGSGSGPQSLTLNIPANSIELVALNNAALPPPPGNDVPEPAACLLTAAGLAALLLRRLRHPV